MSDDEHDEETTPEDLLRAARSRPSAHNWEVLLSWLDDLSDRDPAAYERVEPELIAALEPWPDRLRVIPERWWDIVQEGNLPWGWEIGRKLVPYAGSELDHGDIYEHVTHLDLSELPGISGNDVMYEEVGDFDNLVHLDVCGTGVIYFDIVSGIPSLREIVAYNCHSILGLDCLVRTSLTALSLSPMCEEFVAALGRITTLESLEVDHGEWTSDIEPLAALEHLEALSLDDVTGLRSVRGVERLPRLQSLLLGSDELEDLEPLRGHPTLRRLTLRRCPGLGDLSVLSSIPNLEQVSLPRDHPDRERLINEGLAR